MSVLAQFLSGEIPVNEVSDEDLDFQDIEILVAQTNRLRSFRNKMTRIFYELSERRESTAAELSAAKRDIMSTIEGGIQAKNAAVNEDDRVASIQKTLNEIDLAIKIVQNEISVANSDLQFCRTGMFNKEMRGL